MFVEHHLLCVLPFMEACGEHEDAEGILSVPEKFTAELGSPSVLK